MENTNTHVPLLNRYANLIANYQQLVANLNVENAVYLLNTSVSNSEASLRIGACINRLKIGSVPVDGTIPIDSFVNIGTTTFISQLIGLRDVALSITPTGTNYITAVKMHLGINSAMNKIILNYQPVLYKKVSGSVPGIAQYDVFHGNYYRYNSASGFVLSQNYQTEINRYISEIRIMHLQTTTHEPFIDDEKTDTKSVIYTFQEIFSFINDNMATQKIDLYNAIINTGDLTPLSDIRHTLLLSPGLPILDNKLIGDPDYTTKSADLAHLCPPNCTRITFRTEV